MLAYFSLLRKGENRLLIISGILAVFVNVSVSVSVCVCVCVCVCGILGCLCHIFEVSLVAVALREKSSYMKPLLSISELR